MQPPFPAPITEWRNDTYAEIDPNRPELSVKNKIVVITGGGTGIGRETVQAFAVAGAAHIHILGRTKSNLVETKEIVEKSVPSTAITVHAADVTDEKNIEEVAATIGAWDVLVSNAGYLSKASPIKDVNVNDWWLGLEVSLVRHVLLNFTEYHLDQCERRCHCGKGIYAPWKSESFCHFGLFRCCQPSRSNSGRVFFICSIKTCGDQIIRIHRSRVSGYSGDHNPSRGSGDGYERKVRAL
jgi:NAD(P)-dependent dehydrogenase (short-subunit alcohol dehydrogenase family)